MYNFDKIIDRRNTNSLKWNVDENELPMWVADMDFETAPEIKEELKKCVDRGIFGYSVIPEQWYDAVIYWWEKRYNFKIEKDWLQFCSGVVSAVNCVIKRVTNLGDNVLLQTPVYNAFFNCIKNQGRNIVANELVYKDCEYSIDFEDLEYKLSNPSTTMMILCNPQNPSGKIWTKKELEKIGELCYKYNVVLLSDEIHCDLTDPNCSYIPFASVSDICRNISITCVSTSKTFNIAGLHSAAVIIPNEKLKNNIVRGLNIDRYSAVNSFAVDATIAAYTKGEQWVDELRNYLYENKNIVYDFIENELPNLKVLKAQATYLMWIDCSKIANNSSELCNFIREKTGLYVSKGVNYKGNGINFMRMNIACPKEILMDGLSRLKSGVMEYKKEK